MREMRRLSALLGTEVIMAPDTSGVLDAGTDASPSFFPAGGTTMDELRGLGSCRAALAAGPTASGPAIQALEKKAGMPCETVELPIGLSATDRFVEALRRAAGMPEVPREIRWERSRLVDLLCDMQQYLYGRTVALWGDPDQLVSLVEFCIDMGMRPRYVVTGSPSKSFEKRLAKAVAGRCPDLLVASGHTADMLLLHQWIKQERVDLLLGGTHGKYIARDEGIPLVRHGFPILDRVGHQYFPTAGYLGGMRLVEQILSAFLDAKDAKCPEESFELVM
jgi:nitrogenase molybdenum-iron protein beta chain